MGDIVSFDYNYQNAFRCNLCSADLFHTRAILHNRKKYPEYNSVPQSIMVDVVNWRDNVNVLLKLLHHVV